MKCYRATTIFLMALLLGACSITSPVKLSRQSSYTITGPYLVIPHYSASLTTLLIAQPVANSGYQSSKMIYVDTVYKLKAFAHHRWIAPPTEMLLPLLAEHLRSLGYFKAVVTAPFSGITNYRLDTRLLVLQQEFLRPTSVVRLSIQVTLVSNMTHRVISSRRFQVLVSAPNNDPYSGVLAINKAANIISGRISNFVIQSFHQLK